VGDKVKKIIWLPVFLSWGQYFKRKRVWEFIRLNCFFSVIWLTGYGLFVNNLVSAFSTLSFPFFVLGIQCISALSEKHYPERSISYELADALPVSKYQVLLMRIMSRMMAPSNIVCVVALYFNFYLKGNTSLFSLLGTVCITGLGTVLAEIFAFLSLHTSGFRIEHIFLWMSATEFIRIALTMKIPDTLLHVMLGGMGLLALIFTIVLCGLLKLKRINIKISFKFMTNNFKKDKVLKRSLLLAQKKLTAQGMLLLRDFVLLFKYKPSLLFVGFLLVGNMASDGDKIYYIDPCFYILGFVVAYGMNYFGVENQNFLPVLTSALGQNIILQSKFISFAVVAFLGVIVSGILQVVVFQVPFLTIVSSIVAAIFVIVLYEPVIHFCSIQYYQADKTKKKQSIIRGIIALLSFALVFLPIWLVKVNNGNVITWLLSGMMVVFGTSVFIFMRRKGAYFNKYLERKKQGILEDLSNY